MAVVLRLSHKICLYSLVNSLVKSVVELTLFQFLLHEILFLAFLWVIGMSCAPVFLALISKKFLRLNTGKGLPSPVLLSGLCAVL